MNSVHGIAGGFKCLAVFLNTVTWIELLNLQVNELPSQSVSYSVNYG